MGALTDPDTFRTVVLAWLGALSAVLIAATPFAIALAKSVRAIANAFEGKSSDEPDNKAAQEAVGDNAVVRTNVRSG